MQRHTGWIIAVLVAALPLAGCERSTAKSAPPPPATVQKQDSGVARITLTEKATQRLGIEFAETKQRGQLLEAPYNALLYDANGGEWFFVSAQPNVFVRTGVKVERIDGDTVYLSKGPAAGTKIVTAGAVELFGIEFGIGK